MCIFCIIFWLLVFSSGNSWQTILVTFSTNSEKSSFSKLTVIAYLGEDANLINIGWNDRDRTDSSLPVPIVIIRTPLFFSISACSRAVLRSCASPSVKRIKVSLTSGRSPFVPVKTWDRKKIHTPV